MNGRCGQKQRGMVLILSGVEEMGGNEVRDRIGKSRYQAIRERDPHPMFVELLAGHEGWSSGKLVTKVGPTRPARKLWTRKKVSELAQRLKQGVPVYLFHSQERKPRRPVGEIIASAERWVKGVFGACGIAYITDPEVKKRIKDGELDTCSIEAEVECHRSPQDRENTWMVNAVRKVTGIALGNSRLHKPGFPGAALLAAVEEFIPDQENDNAAPAELSGKNTDKTDPSDNKPSEVFSREKLLDDPVVSEMIMACRERDAQRIHELDSRLEVRNQRIKELSSKLAAYKTDEERRSRAIQAEEAARNILSTKNVTEEERAVILDEIRSRPPENGKVLKEAVAAKVYEEMKKMDRLRELWTRERIPSPPEQESREDSVLANPLIPKPRGW